MSIHRARTCVGVVAAAAVSVLAAAPAWALEEIVRLSPAEDPTGSNGFGFPVGISGSTIVVGASFDPPGLSGAAYVFVRDGLNWVQEAKLKPSDLQPNAFFGTAVAIDGERMVVGAPFIHFDFRGLGFAYVFRREGDTWIEEAKLVSSDSHEGDSFGHAVDIHGDWLVVGAPLDGFVIAEPAAYVFQRQGTQWIERARVTADDPTSWSDFGWSVAIDDDLLVVGAPVDDGSELNSGTVYVFRRDGIAWILETKLDASDAAPGDAFAWSVYVDGDLLVVGAPGDDDAGAVSGSAYVFRRSAGLWSEESKLTAYDGFTSDEFGYAVGASTGTIVVGARLNDDSAKDSGSAYVFTDNTDSWELWGKLVASDAHVGQHVGNSVALDALCSVIGAGRAAYVYWLGAQDNDCNDNCADDAADIMEGTSIDCNANGTPDECEALPDADGDGVSDCYDQCAEVDDNLFAPDCNKAIPTLSGWGALIISLILLVGGKVSS